MEAADDQHCFPYVHVTAKRDGGATGRVVAVQHQRSWEVLDGPSIDEHAKHEVPIAFELHDFGESTYLAKHGDADGAGRNMPPATHSQRIGDGCLRSGHGDHAI